MSITIMQGRLTPPETTHVQTFPKARWADEFPLAAAAGLDGIEWIYDSWGQDVNPIATDEGIGQIGTLSREFGIAVDALCADYFMEHPLVSIPAESCDPWIAHAEWALGQCRKANIRRMVLPFVDAAAIRTPAHEDYVVSVLEELLPTAQASNVELHLETSLGPAQFAALLDRLPDPLIKANYDSGNSSSLGYKVREEFAAYGARIGSVHIKDRLLHGSTVPLGSGDADLPALADALQKIDYSGPFTLQVARATAGDEVNWARHNRGYWQNTWRTETKWTCA